MSRDRNDFGLTERVGTLDLMLVRERRFQRVDAADENQAAQRQAIVPVIGNRDRAPQNRGTAGFLTRGIEERDIHVVLAWRRRERTLHEPRIAGARRLEIEEVVFLERKEVRIALTLLRLLPRRFVGRLLLFVLALLQPENRRRLGRRLRRPPRGAGRRSADGQLARADEDGLDPRRRR